MLAAVLLVLLAGEPERVTAARPTAGPRIREAFAKAGVPYPAGEVFLRAFKDEQQLELWAGPKDRELSLIKRFPICALSGALGPKRRYGDLQVPEGVYRINRFNPWSNFHLSLGLDYPNNADRRAAGASNPGGDIFIHGGCATIGCMPLGDDAIEELYLAAVDARAGGQGSIPVHVFPHRLDSAGLEVLKARDPTQVSFWKTLQPVYEAFERAHRPPPVSVDPKTGQYRLEPWDPPRCRKCGASR